MCGARAAGRPCESAGGRVSRHCVAVRGVRLLPLSFFAGMKEQSCILLCGNHDYVRGLYSS
jgi:hypothetical protein